MLNVAQTHDHSRFYLHFSLQQTIAQFRRWPLEIIRTGLPGAGKTKGGKEEESITGYHGVAYIDLAPLIYPGVSKIRGAYLLQPYNEGEMQNAVNRTTALTDEIKKSIAGINQSNSTVGKGGGGKSLGKNDTKIKVSIISSFSLCKDILEKKLLLNSSKNRLSNGY